MNHESKVGCGGVSTPVHSYSFPSFPVFHTKKFTSFFSLYVVLLEIHIGRRRGSQQELIHGLCIFILCCLIYQGKKMHWNGNDFEIMYSRTEVNFLRYFVPMITEL